MTNTKLVWMDLETTGLHPDDGVILEVGVVITDRELTEVDRRSWVIPHERSEILGKMNDFVLKMHLTSGLLEEVWSGSTFRATQKKRDQIEAEIRRFIVTNTANTDQKHIHLCGNTVGSFDMQWLKRHAASVLGVMSYRVGDVSAFKVFFPGLLDQTDEGAAHRVMPDLEYSIQQLRQMREQVGLISTGRKMLKTEADAQQAILDAAAGL